MEEVRVETIRVVLANNVGGDVGLGRGLVLLHGGSGLLDTY